MQPDEVRQKVLADHVALRARLGELERHAREVLRGERRLIGGLRVAGERLIRDLREHMSWEERYLLPALRHPDAWGEARASQIFQDHREQRALLEFAISQLRDQICPPVMVARRLLDLASLVREDMDEEERLALSARAFSPAQTTADVR